MVPREDLLGLERANTELGGRGGGAGTAASNGAQGSVQPKGYRALDASLALIMAINVVMP